MDHNSVFLAKRSLWWQAVVVVGAMVGAVFVPTAAAVAAPGDFAYGTLRVDANKNEAIDTGVAGEEDLALAGVTVTLRGADPAGTSWTADTQADGSWAFPADDYSANPGPYTVSYDVSGINGDVYATYPNASAENDFARGSSPSIAVSEPFAGDDDTVLDGLVFPTWALDLALAVDPTGYQGLSVYTGSAPWDADTAQAGNDDSSANGVVRTSDIVSYNWSLTAAAEDSLGDSFGDTFFEQTVTMTDGAMAYFPSIPAACVDGYITAYPSGTQIPAKQDPPAGSTSIVLTCNLGEMGEERAAILLPTSVQVSSSSPNGSTFETSARSYAVTDEGVATAQPSESVENGPIEITAAPRYDVEKINGGTGYSGTMEIDGETVAGLLTYYTIQISTDRVLGVEAFDQPIELEESSWAVRSVTGPNGEPIGSTVDDLEWYIDICQPSPATLSGGQNYGSTVFGRFGGIANETNSVRDSGTCSIDRTGGATDNYTLTLDGIDMSGATYPTQSASGATSLAAGPFYVASYRVRTFIPYSELDRMEGEPDDGIGEFSLFNRVGDFDPDGISGASNFGDGVEPGYCAAGPGSDQLDNCDAMEDGRRSNNVAGPLTPRIAPGSWTKYMMDRTTGLWSTATTEIPESSRFHDGAGQVQPGQSFSTRVGVKTEALPLSVQMCDVFDNTMVKMVPLNQDNGGYTDDRYSVVLDTETASYDGQANWQTQYASIDLSGDEANTGVFDLTTDRFEGDWTNQRAATDGENTVCGSPDIDWYDDPNDVPGGIDAVNVAWVQTVGDYKVAAGSQAYWFLTFEQLNTFNGGPNDGEEIPSATVNANFAQVDFGLGSGWGDGRYVPGAGTIGGETFVGENGVGQGDRWTVVRAQMRLLKRTIDLDVAGTASSGAADFGVTGYAVAGKPIVWEIVPTLTAVSDEPAPVENVVITDTLPAHITYDEAATAAIEGGTPASSATVNPDGTTTLVWNFGQQIPNEGIGPLRIATVSDPLTPANTSIMNTAEITADGITATSNHEDEHAVVLEQTGEMQLKKSVDRVLDLQNDSQEYTLQVKNFSENLAIAQPTIIDVLPYNGDATSTAGVNRSPESDYTGGNSLSAAPEVFEFDGVTPASGTFYYTTEDAEDVPQNLSDDTDPSIWSETFTAAATAFKFVADEPLLTESDASKSGLTIVFTTDQTDNSAGDLYTNRFTAFSDTFVNGDRFQLLTSNQVSVRVLGFSVGDLVWFDRNADGVFTEGVDSPAPEGVAIQVFDDEDALVGTATTDEDGRWVVNKLERGDYYAVIPASEFATGGLFEGAIAALSPEPNPNTDLNEDEDHHTIAFAGGVRTKGVLTLDADVDADPIAGLEPLDDNVGNVRLAPLTGDAFSNLTLDMALVEDAEFTITKAVTGDGAAFGSGPFTVSVTCTYDGETVAGFPQNLIFSGAGSETISALEGSVCSATETDDGAATSSAVSDDVTVSSNADDEDEITVTNQFDLGSLNIRKETSGLGAGLSEGVFDFTVVCSLNGVAGVFTDDVQVNVDGAGQATSGDVTGIPVGAECVITETNAGGADETPAPVSIVIDADPETVQTAGFLNEFSVGTVSVLKALDGAAADSEFLQGLTYQVQLTCQIDRDGARVELFSGFLNLIRGEEVAAMLPTVAGEDEARAMFPVDTRCFVSETIAQGAAESVVEMNSFDSGAVVRAGTPDEPVELLIGVTNRFELAELTVSKTVKGPDTDGSYDFTVVCEYPVEGADGVEMVSFPLREADAAFALRNGEERTIEVLSGVTCVVSETNVSAAAMVTMVDTDASSTGGVSDGIVGAMVGTDNRVDVTNTFPEPPPLAVTGSTLSLWALYAGMGLLLAGAVVFFITRRRRHVAASDSEHTPSM